MTRVETTVKGRTLMLLGALALLGAALVLITLNSPPRKASVVDAAGLSDAYG
jgi:hypothetical protein